LLPTTEMTGESFDDLGCREAGVVECMKVELLEP
jgi:hypothetical protein